MNDRPLTVDQYEQRFGSEYAHPTVQQWLNSIDEGSTKERTLIAENHMRDKDMVIKCVMENHTLTITDQREIIDSLMATNLAQAKLLFALGREMARQIEGAEKFLVQQRCTPGVRANRRTPFRGNRSIMP